MTLKINTRSPCYWRTTPLYSAPHRIQFLVMIILNPIATSEASGWGEAWAAYGSCPRFWRPLNLLRWHHFMSKLPQCNSLRLRDFYDTDGQHALVHMVFQASVYGGDAEFEQSLNAFDWCSGLCLGFFSLFCLAFRKFISFGFSLVVFIKGLTCLRLNPYYFSNIHSIVTCLFLPAVIAYNIKSTILAIPTTF